MYFSWIKPFLFEKDTNSFSAKNHRVKEPESDLAILTMHHKNFSKQTFFFQLKCLFDMNRYHSHISTFAKFEHFVNREKFLKETLPISQFIFRALRTFVFFFQILKTYNLFTRTRDSCDLLRIGNLKCYFNGE